MRYYCQTLPVRVLRVPGNGGGCSRELSVRAKPCVSNICGVKLSIRQESQRRPMGKAGDKFTPVIDSPVERRTMAIIDLSIFHYTVRAELVEALLPFDKLRANGFSTSSGRTDWVCHDLWKDQ